MAYRMTKTERIARRGYYRDLYVLKNLERPDYDELRRELPEEWHMLAEDVDLTEEKVKVTLYLDKSVARTFRGMGKGHQSMMNRVLRTYLQAGMAGFLERDRRRLKRRMDHLIEAGEGRLQDLQIARGVPMMRPIGYDDVDEYHPEDKAAKGRGWDPEDLGEAGA